MPFIANTDAERQEMLAFLGLDSMQQLWQKAHVPEPEFDFSQLPAGISELEVSRHFNDLAAKNGSGLVSFLGMGHYDHFIPAAVSDVLIQAGFYTSYTPYQPEASQGTLQAIFEWQTAICRLAGMEVANASLYDGGSAIFEALTMSMRSTRRRNEIVVSEAVSPIHRKMLDTYCASLDLKIIPVPARAEKSDIAGILAAVNESTACVIVQYPNVFGSIEDWSSAVAAIKEKGALAVCSAYPTALALLKTPGEMGFDIVIGEGQPLGMPLSFGGPYLGYMCTTNKLLRKMPGRIAGQTTDSRGRTGYVLTLQAREQHIRREQAMSNICSNNNLCAVAALVYMSVLGKEGLREVASLCHDKAAYARQRLSAIPGVEALGDSPFFNEFVLQLPTDAKPLLAELLKKGYAAGVPLGKYYPGRERQLLVAVTEKRDKAEIDLLAESLEALL
ncbi:MAG: aminomethyl-transferring glycine dehydrogenase subunit GcvPA [Oligosphaeraceae bacterium]|nr:aminomethyl-transferring glycine dehydrogenase subunit GcvPA [Oligosphaeraceae bacterium]